MKRSRVFIISAVMLAIAAFSVLLSPLCVSASSTDTTPEVPITMPKAVETVALSAAPSKTLYMKDEALDVSGGRLMITYSDGSSEEKEINIAWCRGFNSSSPGEVTVSVVYPDGGAPVSFGVLIIAEREISITQLPAKTTYYTEDSLSLTGLVVTLIYTDSSTVVLNGADYTVTGFDSSTAGEKTLTVTYHGLTADFTVMVKDPVMTRIEIINQPVKISYYTGETLDTTGILVRATYDSGKTEDVTSRVSYSGFSSASAGRRTVTVSLEAGQMRFVDTFSVTVTALAVSSIEIGQLPDKTEYYDGEEFAGAGLILRVIYNSGASADIPYGDGIACEGFQSDTIGEKTIKVRFSGLETSFIVTVTVSPEHVHTPGEFSVTTDATCAAPGEMTAYCLVCGEIAATEPTEALPHTYGDWATLTAPTAEAEGSEGRTCTVCGHTEERSLPRLGQTLTCGSFTAAALGDYYYQSGASLSAYDIMASLTSAEIASFFAAAQSLTGGEPLTVYDITFLNSAGEGFVPGCTVRYTAPLPANVSEYESVVLFRDGAVIAAEVENGFLVFESTVTGRFYMAGILPTPETTVEITQEITLPPEQSTAAPDVTTGVDDITTGGDSQTPETTAEAPESTTEPADHFTGAFRPILITVGIIVGIALVFGGLYMFVIRRFY